MSTPTLHVADTETTGLGDHDEVCEMAYSTLVSTDGRYQPVNDGAWTLVRPRVPVGIEAKATHHISDEELKDAPTMERLLLDGKMGFEPGSVLVAHNAEFDIRMLRQSGVPANYIPELVICTWRCAQHLYPDAPRHTNQVLRYYLDARVRTISDLPPHRALPDVAVTEAVLLVMLEKNTPEELIALTKKPVILKTCNFGEHKGKLWSQVPKETLRWILSKGPRRKNPAGGFDLGFPEDVRVTAQHYLT